MAKQFHKCYLAVTIEENPTSGASLLMNKPRALTITVEAKSDEHLRKLLELALFDLNKLQEDVAWRRDEGESIPTSMTGGMGCYRLEYKLGSHALIAAHEELVEQGYRKVETTEWKTDNYSIYDHTEKAPLRLYLSSAETREHDAEEHEENNIRF
ncbi:hypothetical protein [Pseudomonas syringae]|uniref:hypothetical protein n=1 Tax=Pseudomonas syringae TaxID=317 RepID=UPI0018E5F94F|nr:hypothetical protein [Pseudomonas syringae]MBI6799154.1 hypothetical protein [Pseudomonas syringae]